LVSGRHDVNYSNHDSTILIHERMGKDKIILLFRNTVGYNVSYHGYCYRGNIELSRDTLYVYDNFHYPPNVQLSDRARELDDSKKLIFQK
jgi:hypothetical protein